LNPPGKTGHDSLCRARQLVTHLDISRRSFVVLHNKALPTGQILLPAWSDAP